MESKTLGPNEIIFKEGDLSNEAYRLLSGGVEISIAVDGRKVVLAQLAPGDIFGEMAMIDEHPRSATAATTVESEVEVMTPEDFNACIIQDPATLTPYLASFFERLRTTNDRLRVELRRNDTTRQGATSLERTRMPAPAGTTSSVARPRRDQPAPAPTATSTTRRVLLKAPNPLVPTRQGPSTAIEITKFPYRIGREEHRSVPSVFSTNDYVLKDEQPYQVSRNHCSIECEGDHLFVRDRGSMVGTIVNGVQLGAGQNHLTADLAPGENTLILGVESSPFRFILEVQ